MRNTRQQTGFTLIEMIMVILLLGIIGAVTVKVLSQGLLAVQTEQLVNDAVWQGQIAIQRMVREISMARSPADISTASADTFAFTDINGNTITYARGKTTLTRNGIALADGISSLTFSYQDRNGNTTADATTIRYVTISINVTLNNGNYTVTSGVNLRDLIA